MGVDYFLPGRLGVRVRFGVELFGRSTRRGVHSTLELMCGGYLGPP